MSKPAKVDETPECWASQSDLVVALAGHARFASLAMCLHDETLEAKLALEDVVLEIRVLAGLRVVDLVVRAHDGTRAGADGVSKGPQVQLVQSLVVQVGADGIDKAKVSEIAGLAEMLLLVHNEVLGAGNDTSILDTANGFSNCYTRENRIGAKALPVTLQDG